MKTHQASKSVDQVRPAKRAGYVRPAMHTVITPKEIRDIDQPCAFYEPKKKKGPKK